MVDHSTESLHHGHLGDGTYNAVERMWTFPTSLTKIPQSHIVDASSPPEVSGQLSVVGDQSTHTAKRRRDVRRILQSHPEFLGADQALLSALQAPTVSKQHTRFDHRTGTLLATITIEVARSQKLSLINRFRTLVAFAGGTNVETLNLVSLLPGTAQLPTSNYGTGRSRESPRSDKATWSKKTERILQICFSARVDASTAFLAVRYDSSIEILSPQIKNVNESPRIEVQHITTLAQSHSSQDGTRIVHISFNPQNPVYLASVNSSGRWHIWRIDKKKSTAIIFRKGRLQLSEPENTSKHTGDDHDDWYRIFWFGYEWMVTICTNNRIYIINLSTSSTGQNVFEWTNDKSSTALDVLVRPSRQWEIFILTTSKIYWLKAMPKPADANRLFLPSVEFIFDWTHYRDRTDRTLRLSFRNSSSGFALYLYSRERSHVEAYHIVSQTEILDMFSQTRFMTRVVQPFPSTFPLVHNQPLSDLRFEPLVDAHVETLVAKLPDTTKAQLTSVMRVICLSGDLQMSLQFDIGSMAPWWSASEANNLLSEAVSVRVDPKRTGKTRAATNSFVVEDEDDASHSDDYGSIEQLKAERALASSSQLHFATQIDSQGTSAKRGVSFRELYCDLATPPSVDERAIERKFSILSANLKQASEEGNVVYQTLSSFWPPSQVIGDPTRLWEGLQHLKNSASLQDVGLEFHNPASVVTLPFGDTTDATLPSIYQSLMDDWHASLSPTAPGQVRLSKERFLRFAACELYLSGLCVRSTGGGDLQKDGQSVRDESMRAATPQSHSVQAVADSNKSGSEPRTIADSEPSAIARLRRYTTMSDEAHLVSDACNGILSHWTVGTNPAHYDYEAMTAALARAREAKSSSSKSAKLKRRAERELARATKRDNRALADPRDTASQPAAGQQVFGSSQDVSQMHPSSSQIQSPHPAQGPAVTASQITSGRHGGRIPTRVKRKRGF